MLGCQVIEGVGRGFEWEFRDDLEVQPTRPSTGGSAPAFHAIVAVVSVVCTSSRVRVSGSPERSPPRGSPSPWDRFGFGSRRHPPPPLERRSLFLPAGPAQPVDWWSPQPACVRCHPETGSDAIPDGSVAGCQVRTTSVALWTRTSRVAPSAHAGDSSSTGGAGVGLFGAPIDLAGVFGGLRPLSPLPVLRFQDLAVWSSVHVHRTWSTVSLQVWPSLHPHPVPWLLLRSLRQ